MDDLAVHVTNNIDNLLKIENVETNISFMFQEKEELLINCNRVAKMNMAKNQAASVLLFLLNNSLTNKLGNLRMKWLTN